MAKADKALSARRVREIYAIRLDGARWVDVVQFVREKEAEQDSAWCVGPDARPLTEGMIRKYQQRADALLMQSDEKSRRKSFRRHLAQRRHLYSKSVLAGDYRSALAAARDEAELLGLYPAKGVAVAGRNGGPIVLNITEEVVHRQAAPALNVIEEVVTSAPGSNRTNGTPPDGPPAPGPA
jgi:hypothetical protein